MLEGIDELYATRGSRVIRVDLTTGNATRAEIAALIIGPSGNLRAPTVRIGTKLLVGFDEVTYRQLAK